MKPTLIANWKMHGLRHAGHELATAIESFVTRHRPPCEVVLCPPFTLLHTVGEALTSSLVKMGGQDCHTEQSGAFTGDISAAMLRDSGCDYVILGHSERRKYHQELCPLVKQKAAAAHSQQLQTVICIGETLEERQQGNTLDVLAWQLERSLPSCATPENTLIAYEPVWAIGTGLTASLPEIAEAAQYIKKAFENGIRLLYGGSVNTANASDILKLPDINGLLVGGASLKAEEFCGIMETSVSVS